jgi:cytosine/adenosine deaminase-related metal-dependent hydrolase
VIRYHARYVLPITSAPIERGTVTVDGERIAYVGARAHAPAGDDVDLGDVLLLPGLVNAHCHLELTAMRGFLEGMNFRQWIVRLTSAKRAVLDRTMLLDAARYGVAEGVRAGITTYADTCESGVAFDAMIERGVRGIVYQEVFGPDPAQCETSMNELRVKVGALRPRETPLVRVGISPHAPYTVSDALFAAAAAYARQERLPIAIHIAESELESQLLRDGAGDFADGLRRRGIAVSPRARSPIALLSSLGVLSARPLLIHCVRVDGSDVGAIADARCAVAHCPASNAKLGHGIAPLDELLDASIDVGLGSDSMASNNYMDILGEARLAVLAQRARSGAHAHVDAARALALATIDGARALGLAHRIGSIEVGKSADLAAFSCESVLPIHDPATAAVFSVTGRAARFVCAAGRVLLRNGSLVDDDPSLGERVQHGADALARWLATESITAGPLPSLTR